MGGRQAKVGEWEGTWVLKQPEQLGKLPEATGMSKLIAPDTH